MKRQGGRERAKDKERLVGNLEVKIEAGSQLQQLTSLSTLIHPCLNPYKVLIIILSVSLSLSLASLIPQVELDSTFLTLLFCFLSFLHDPSLLTFVTCL